MSSPSPHRHPPPDLHGSFTTDPAVRERHARAAGPLSIAPSAVAAPVDADDLSRLVRWAAETGTPLVPRGAATGMPGGNVGRGVAVDLLAHFGEVGPPDRERHRITVGAGAVASRIQDAAERVGLSPPPLPSSADRCTVGGMVANNAAGARSFRHGAIREWVDGLGVVLADGRAAELSRVDAPPPPFPGLLGALRPRSERILAEWPRVRKNSSGYALDRFLPTGDALQLLVGSEGTLAIVTSVTLRLAPRPPSRGLHVVGVDGPEALLPVIRAAGAVDAEACEFLGRRFVEVASLEEHPGVGPLARGRWGLVLVEVAGSDEEVREALDALRDGAAGRGDPSREATELRERERLWGIRHAASPIVAGSARRGLLSTQFIEDSVVPPDRLPDYLRGLDSILRSAGLDAVIFGHAGDGNVHVNPLVDVSRTGWKDVVREVLDETAALVAGLGGTLAGEHGDGRLRAPLLERIWPSAALEAFHTVKDTLDPSGILNPGVILPLPGQDPLEGLWTRLPDEVAGTVPADGP